MTTCAIDGWREATARVEIDGRIYAACDRCLAEVPAPPSEVEERCSVRLLALRYVLGPGSIGVDSNTVALALGMSGDEALRNAVSKALSRLVRDGFLEVSGTQNERFYRPGRREIESARWKGIRRSA